MNKYVSIDIETTGLDEEYCQILEIGLVIEDWVTPIEELPSRRILVKNELPIIGQPFALHMNAALILESSERGIKPADVTEKIRGFLMYHHIDPKEFVVAGKNFNCFDKKFLSKLPKWQWLVPHRRAIDPVMLYYDPKIDAVPPSLNTCLERAGFEGNVTHEAVEDARDVIRCVRSYYV